MATDRKRPEAGHRLSAKNTAMHAFMELFNLARWSPRPARRGWNARTLAALLWVTLGMAAQAAAPVVTIPSPAPAGIFDDQTSQPFSTATISSATDVTVKVSFTAGAGTLSGPPGMSASISGGIITYTLSSRPVVIAQNDLRFLIFTPTPNRIAITTTESLVFSVTATNTGNETSPAATVSLVVTPRNDVPVFNLSGSASQIYDNQTSTPFSGALIVDPDAGDTLEVTISYTAAHGTLVKGPASPSIALNGSAGGYNFSGSVADVLSLLQKLVFNPTDNRLPVFPPGDTTENTVFTVIVSDLSVGGLFRFRTQPVESFNDAPSLAGSLFSPLNDSAGPTGVFNTLTVQDPDLVKQGSQLVPQPVILVVTLSDDPILAGAGGFVGQADITRFEFSGTASPTLANNQVTTALRALQYDPVANRVPVGVSTTVPIGFSATDSLGASLNTSQNLSILSINDPPTIVASLNPNTVSDTGSIQPFSVTVSDPDVGDTFQVQITSLSNPSAGSFSPAGPYVGNSPDTVAQALGLVRYTSQQFQSVNTPVTFKLRVTDVHSDPATPSGTGVAFADSTTLTITILGKNRPTELAVPKALLFPTTDDPALCASENTRIKPLGGINISDADASSLTLRIGIVGDPTGATGDFYEGGGMVGSNPLILTGSPADLSTRIKQVTFCAHPQSDRVLGQQETLTVLIEVTDAALNKVQDQTRQIVVTSVDGAPVIENVPALADQPVRVDPATTTEPIRPFGSSLPTTITISNDDTNEVTVVVRIDDPAKGRFSPAFLGGFQEDAGPGGAATGVYRMTSTNLPAINGSLSNLVYLVSDTFLFPATEPGKTTFKIEAQDLVLNKSTAELTIVVAEEPLNWLVTSVEDDPTEAGTLRWVINQIAAAKSSSAYVTFALGEYPAVIRLNKTNAPLVLNRNVVLKGPGADLLSISGDSNGDGRGDMQLFQVLAAVRMDCLTLTHGAATQGTNLSGGAVYVGSTGTLTLHSCVVRDSLALQWGGGVDVDGGALHAERTLFRNNRTDEALGIGGAGVSLFTDKACSFVNSTFSANRQASATGIGGGGMYVENLTPASTLSVKVTNCTFAENSDATSEGATSIHANVFGSGVELLNSIFADGATRNLDILGAASMRSKGGNVSDDRTRTVLTQDGQPKDVTILDQTSDALLQTRILELPLDESMRPVPGYRLARNSPAIGRALLPVPATDQLGYWRDSDPDSGALERGSLPRLVLNEINFDPGCAGIPSFLEFFVPLDAQRVQLGGLILRVNGTNVLTIPSTEVLPGSGIIFANSSFVAAGIPSATPVIPTTLPLGLQKRGLVELVKADGTVVLGVQYVAQFIDPNDPLNLTRFDNTSATLAPQTRGCAFLPHGIVAAGPLSGTKDGFSEGTLADVTSPACSAGSRITTPFGSSNGFPFAVNDGFIVDEDLAADLPVLVNDLDEDGTDRLIITGASATSVQGATVSLQPDSPAGRGAYLRYDPQPSATLKALPVGYELVDTLSYTVIDVGSGEIEAIASGGAGTLLITATGHRLVDGQDVIITGSSTAAYNVQKPATVVNVNQFTIPVAFVDNPTEPGRWETLLPRSPSASSTATVSLTVLGANDPPEPKPDSIASTEVNEDVPVRIMAGPRLAGIATSFDTDASYPVKPRVAQLSTLLGGTVASATDQDTDPDSDEVTTPTSSTLRVVGVVSSVTPIKAFAPSATTGTAYAVAESPAHGLDDGDVVLISGYTGYSGYNGFQKVTVVDADHFLIPVLYVDNAPEANPAAARGLWTILTDANRLQTTTALGATVKLEIRVDPLETSVVYNGATSAELNKLAVGETRKDSFYYAVSDTHGAVSIAPVELTVAGVNDAPVPVADPPGIGGIAGLVQPGKTLGETLSGLPIAYYLPPASGTPGRADLELLGPGQPPTRFPLADVFRTDEETVLDIAGTDLTSNDLDVDSTDALRVSAVHGPSLAGATLTLVGGNVRYNPLLSTQLQSLSREEAFLDTFEVTITDDETGSVRSWVAVLVVGVNDKPDAIDDLASTNEDTPVTINPLVNDVDPDEDGPLPNNVLRLVPEDKFTAYGAKVTIGPESFTYDPTTSAYLQGLAVGQTATESVPTTTMDGSFVFANDDEFQVAADQANLTLEVGVNDQNFTGTGKPVQGYFSVADGLLTGVTAPNHGLSSGMLVHIAGYGGTGAYNRAHRIQVIDSNSFALPLAYVDNAAAKGLWSRLRITGVTAASRGGSVVADAALGGLAYSPAINFVGDEVFAYTLQDDLGNTDRALVRVRVVVNQLNGNLQAKPDQFTVARGQTPTLDVLANDNILPAPGQNLTITRIVAPPAIVGGGPLRDAVEIVGNQVRYLQTFGGSTADYPYLVRFTYEVSGGGTARAVAEVIVRVVDRGDTLPTRPDAFAVLAGSNGNVLGVLDNDRVLPGSSEALTVAAIVTAPTSGQASVSADGLTVLYTPNAGFVGEDTFTYRATDGLGGTGVANVLVAVGGLATRNDFVAAPYDDPAITTDGGMVKFDVLANDPVVNSATVNLRLTGVVALAPPATPLGTIQPSLDGKLIEFTPTAGREGEQTFEYTIADQSVPPKTAKGRLVVIVARTSVRASSDVFAIAAGSQANPLAVLANDVAIPDRGRALTIVSIGTGLDAPNRGGNVTINEARDGLVYTPAFGFIGQEVFTYTMTDSRGTDTARVIVNVGTGSLTASPDAYVVFFDNAGTQEFTLPVLFNDRVLPDDGQALVITGVGIDDANGLNAPTENGKVQIAPGGGSLVYIANANVTPPYTERFTYEITDGTARRSQAEVLVRVENRAGARELETNDDAYTVAKASTGNLLNVLINDGVKPAGTAGWTVKVKTTPNQGGTAAPAADGRRIVYTPAPTFVGTEVLEYEVADGIGGTASATVAIKVGDIILSPDAFAALSGSTGNLLDVLANDAILPETSAVNLDNGDADYRLASARNPSAGGSVGVLNGLVVYAPAATPPVGGYPYVETFEYVVRDDSDVEYVGQARVEVHLLGSDRDSSRVLLTITGVNDPPTLTVPVTEYTITDKQTVAPFAGVVIGEVDNQGLEVLEVRVVLNDPAAGRLLNLGGFAETFFGSGVWIFNGTGAAATTAIQGLMFDPTENYVIVPQTWPFVFDILVTDPYVPLPIAGSVTVKVRAINDAPLISGTVRGQPVHYLGSIQPFASVLITEVDDLTLQRLAVTVSFDGTRGTLVNPQGFVLVSPGVYAFQGTAAQATAAIRLLVFAPSTESRLVVDTTWPPSSEETFFTITVNDGFADPVVDSNTSVIAYHSLVTKILATDGSKPDQLGFSVGASKGLVAIGAPRDSDLGRDSGRAYVWEQNTATPPNWVRRARLQATDPVLDARFGHAVSVTARTIAVGAPLGRSGTRVQGAAYVFESNTATGTNWQSLAIKILASDGAASDEFGQAVSISGNFLAVGAHLADLSGGRTDAGAVYIYRRTALGSWVQAAKIIAPDAAAADRFGFAVSLSGESLAVGAPGDADNGRDSGSAYVFRRTDANGTTWTMVKKVLPTLAGGATDGAAGDFFGFAVAINEGNLLVGSPRDDDVGNDRGSAFVFNQNVGGANNWGQVAKLAPSQTLNVDQFGFSVTLDDDTAVVGMPFSGESNQSRWGSAWVYRRNQGGTNVWGFFEKLDPPDNINNDEFGRSVALACGTLAVGSRMDDTVALNAGAAYIYDVAYVKAPRVGTPIPDQFAVVGTPFSYQIPSSTFGDADVGDPLAYSVTLSSGGALPAWLTFNAATRTLSGTPPAGSQGTSLLLAVRATDRCGGTASTPLRIDIFLTPPPRLPDPGAPLTYEQWITRLLTSRLLQPALESTVWGRLANPDEDDFFNFEEYAFGTRLFQAAPDDGPRLMTAVAPDGRVAISYRRRTNDASLRFTLEYSVDLQVWTDAATLPNTQEILTREGYDLQWVTLLVPPDALVPNLFFRVRISTN